MSKRVIQLLRVSTERQAADDKAGLAAQRAINQRTAATYGLVVVKTIEMSDVSGTAVLRAPEMQELLRLIESSDIHGVIAKEFSRPTRPENFKDYELLQAFVDSNTVLYLPDGPIDFASSMGGFIGMIRAGMARIERREILARMNDAKEAMRLAGWNTGGRSTLPFGVDYSDSRGWSYTAEAEKVRAAFDLVRSTSSTCCTPRSRGDSTCPERTFDSSCGTRSTWESGNMTSAGTRRQRGTRRETTAAKVTGGRFCVRRKT